MRKKIAKIILYFLGFVVIIFLSLFAYGYNFYRSVFRLSATEISNIISEQKPSCVNLKDCKLEPGDILIRRYVTSTSEIFNSYFKPYFTHSAVYLGNDELFEALGDDQTPEDQIKISRLSKGDWTRGNLIGFVIIRPKYSQNTLAEFENSLRKIANDPEYTFGPWNPSTKKASCSDSIYNELINNSIIERDINPPKYITPDFLFWFTLNHKNEFEIIGYNIREG